MEHHKHADSHALSMPRSPPATGSTRRAAHPEFTAALPKGCPSASAGARWAPAMRRNAWARIGPDFEPALNRIASLDLADGRLLVTGRYRGRANMRGHPRRSLCRI